MSTEVVAINLELHPVLHLQRKSPLSISIVEDPDASFARLDPNDSGNGDESAHGRSLPSRSRSNIPVNRDKRKKRESWRVAVAMATLGTSTVLLSNVLLLAVASRLSSDTTDSIETMYRGSCKTANTWTTGLHLLVNVLSSLLLSASNYTMQCLAAPTRAELDKVHSNELWLDIGVPSLRNILGGVSKRRSQMWTLLCCSSLPIHFFYNSAIFKSTNANYYKVALVTESFVQGLPLAEDMARWNQTLTAKIEPGSQLDYADMYYPEVRRMQEHFQKGSDGTNYWIENLTNSQCIEKYAREIVTDRTDLLLITGDYAQTQNIRLIEYISFAGGSNQGYRWMCTEFDRLNRCDLSVSKPEASTWHLGTHEIAYCLSKHVKERCQVQFSVKIMVIVIVCNVIKATVMLWTLFCQRESTLVTVGDAIASYLDRPDDWTSQHCSMDKWIATTVYHKRSQPSSRTMPLKCHRWFTTTSKGLWSTPLVISSCLLGACTFYLSRHAGKISSSFGAINPSAFFEAQTSSGGSAADLVVVTLLVNFPHVICNLLYFMYNGLFTAMLSASEWNHYYLRPKPLRTSTPRGEQRSKYFLQLPFKYSIPLIAASTILHWLISESIFLARIGTYDEDIAALDGYLVQEGEAGSSALPILIFIILGSMIVLAAFVIGLRSFTTPMRVAASCSLSIAAACHRPPEDVDAAYLPVSWGEVKRMGTEDLGHCCFTSEEVCAVEPGRLYAGRKDD